ncbi:MAG: RNA-metabolising metallo-beta-lactamase [Candidatus Magasanikbacteria bacterium GW2011_GWA2_46_17]|uniref:Ribonuclease J n=1 Tax=Candidatus Magasanikbacteria bacterium GW2011_GWA2_46_17 TaxID=1619042 RepID=A0A0G1S277_9BACT|nr:MAG: RNA-metabolising metallo-beta-lactamase [Candidatus Magasanikbacteria bacterium GW2011_GWA2_46_17]
MITPISAKQRRGGFSRPRRVFRTRGGALAAPSAHAPSQEAPGAQPSFSRFRGDETKLKVAVLGGLEEVGRNCTLIEYNGDIIIIDMGLQFPEEDMPGIDYIIPNIGYLKGKEKNIRGVIITHAHYDHIGGIPHLIPQLGYPPIYGLPMTNAIIKKRQEDYRGLRPLNIHNLKVADKLRLGSFEVEFFHLNHNIPDSMGVVVNTPEGVVVHTGDWKFDYQPAGEAPADLQRIAQIGAQGVMALMSDSTNASQPGHQLSESEIGTNLDDIIGKAPGRIIIGTFSSLLARIKQIIEISEKLGKVVALDGFSMKSNVEIAKELGYMKFSPRTLIDLKIANNYPDNKIVIICTGAQGEKNASLMRIANGEHRLIKLTQGDTVIFSSSVIPGNERTVQRLKDTLFRKGAEVIHYQMMDVHAGGHAKADDVKLMIRLLNPKYFIPIEGNHFLLHYNAKVAASMGFPKENIFISDNGQVMEFKAGAGKQTKVKLPADYVFVDGLGVSDETNIVLRDRQVLAEDGMIVVIATVDSKTGRLVQNPDIISRGFVFLKENKELIEDLRHRVKKLVIDSDPLSWADTNYIRNKIRDYVGQFLYTKTEKRPMVLPVVIEV